MQAAKLLILKLENENIFDALLTCGQLSPLGHIEFVKSCVYEI